jgi:lipopolysaccharide biosynthesis glycosyltransferase
MGRMTGKICITTTFDYNYIRGGQALFKSIKRHTDCTGVDFKVITSDPRVVTELGAENCHIVTDAIKIRYSNVKYSKDLPEEKYRSSWYRYEMFNFTGYDRVICIDSDCLCLEDISYLFSEELNQYDLISVEDHIVSKCFLKSVPPLEAQGLNFCTLRQRMSEGKIDIQPALLVANKSIVNRDWYNKLLIYANTTDFTYSIDEGILNDFIYLNGLKIKLLPLEWDYQDLYEIHCPQLPVPSRPILVHCQESKPFKKTRDSLDPRMHKWYDRWWEEYRSGTKTIVSVIVWNRFENLKLWLRCWKQCDPAGAELVIVHNQERDNARYEHLCQTYGVRYVPRENTGFDIGAFQDVCKERLAGFPNNWDTLIWITDDCIPMKKDFVNQFLSNLAGNRIPCYEISNEVKLHVRTTGFLVTKDISRKIVFPRDPITSREDCYQFEHKGINLYEQLKQLGLEPVMVAKDLRNSPLWDTGCRAGLRLMPLHEKMFPVTQAPRPVPRVSRGLLDDLAIKYKADKSSLYHNFAEKYDRLLGGSRDKVTNILEIGVAQGQSLRMWADYFPKATIHGVDISSASKVCETYSPRIKFHLVDQGNEVQLKNLEQFSPYDLIVDDGNHFWREQILSFQTLFPYVRKGGIYIVEDSCTSYWPEYRDHPISCVDYFKGLVDEVNLHGAKGRVPSNPPPEFTDWDKGWHRREDCHTVPAFESIQFLNGIIVVQKR